MTLYNTLYGMNPAVFFYGPMLGKHPAEYPRFRDMFLGKLTRSTDTDPYGIPLRKTDDQEVITILTRTGGANREEYREENQMMRDMPGFIEDYDDSFDNTFACWVFEIPEKWKKDYRALREMKVSEVSMAYRKQMEKIYPKLQTTFNQMWKTAVKIEKANKTKNNGTL